MSQTPESVNPNDPIIRALHDNERDHQVGGETRGVTQEVGEDLGFQSAEEAAELAAYHRDPNSPTLTDRTGAVSSARRIRSYLDSHLVDVARAEDPESATAGITVRRVKEGNKEFDIFKKENRQVVVPVDEDIVRRSENAKSTLIDGGGQVTDDEA